MIKNKTNCDLQFKDFIYDIVDGNAVITKYRGEAKTLYVPSHINGYEVVEFDVFEFGSEEVSKVRNIILPGTIQRFDFWNRNLIRMVRIESGCESISDGAFAYLKSLEFVDLPDTVKTIGKEAFAECKSLQYIRIPEGCTQIGDNAFAYSGLSDIYIPKSVKKMGKNPFCGCDILSLHIHPENKNFELIDEMILYSADHSRLIRCQPGYPKILEVPKELTSVDFTALIGCELYGYKIPDGCKAFDGMEIQYNLM